MNKKAARRKRGSIDSTPEPTPNFSNAHYLEQVSLGRWIDDSYSAHLPMQPAFQTLAEFIGWRAERYLFPDGATDQQRQRFVQVLAGSYARGFYLAVLRYRDDLKHVPEAAALLEKKRFAAKKGGDARRKQAEPNHKAIRKRFRELRKTVPKKTARYVRVAGEFEMSDRQIARIVDGID